MEEHMIGRQTLAPLTALALALSACGGSSETTDATDGPDNTACLSTDGQSPSIISGKIRCEPPLQDDQPPFIYIDITGEDPQGWFTIKRFGDNVFRAYLAANDQLSAEDKIITCDPDAEGVCTGSISGDQIGVSCGTMSNFRFTAVIADQDGNLSPECDLVLD